MHPPFYNNFEEMLGSSDLINLKCVGTGIFPAKTDDTEKSRQPGSPILELGK